MATDTEIEHGDSVTEPRATRGGSEDLVEAARHRATLPLEARELRVELIAGLLFVVAGGTLFALAPVDLNVPLALALVGAYALASHIRFEVGAGFTVPTQLVVVPMFLLLPPAAVPLLVVAGNLLSELPDYIRGQRHPQRAVVALGNAWFAVGPALVLVLAGSPAGSLDRWPLYVVALLAQFVFDFAATIAREWYEYGIPPRSQLADASWIWAVDGLLSPIALVAAIAAPDENLLFLTLLPLLGLLALFARERRGRLEQALELRNAYLGTTILLADLIEEDDEYTGAHSQGVVALAVAVADELHLDHWQRRRTEYAARLHDVGKIAVPKEIINKPGPLDPHEWALMREHTVEGERMLARVGGALREVGAIVRASHERWDGTGYPDHLEGTDIPMEARIVACCDAFDAMTTDRSYRTAMSVQTALLEIRAEAGTQFDPQVAAALVSVVERQPTRVPPASPREQSLRPALSS